MKHGVYGEENDENLKLVIAISRTMQRLRRHDTGYIREAGLTVSQFGLLEVLYHKGDLRVCEIIEKTLATGGNLTVIIHNLEQDGYVTRRRDPQDGRSSIIQISGKGRAAIAALWARHLEQIHKAFQNLDMQEKKQLRSLLKKLNGLV